MSIEEYEIENRHLRERVATLSGELERLLHIEQWASKRDEYYAGMERLGELLTEAGAEIERLRAENAILTARLDNLRD